MDLQVDIFQCGDDHIHVVLRGDGVGNLTFSDFECFLRFLEICRRFAVRNPEIPSAFLDAFADDQP